MANGNLDLTLLTPGATLLPGGVAFRTWAPRARSVFVCGPFNGWQETPDWRLHEIGGGHWARFFPGLGVGTEYLFHIEGPGDSGFKRDPHARALSASPPFPFCNCVVRDPGAFPWHETGFRTPAFNDLIIYQLHTGTYSIAPGNFNGKFLDVIDRIPHLVRLGINAIQLLPVVEFPTEFSLGYNGTDYYSPEADYGEHEAADLQKYLDRINALLRGRGLAEYPGRESIQGSDDQLRALVDLCHIHGIAVLFDAVYNHAGGGFDDQSLWFFDRMPRGDNNDSLYFTADGWAGGLVFDYWNRDVRRFLIDNARCFFEEYRIDGLRMDEVSVMDRFGGWETCRELTESCRAARPEAIQIAEYWPVNDWTTRPVAAGGAGFDAAWHDGLREAVRGAIAQSAGGAGAAVNLDGIAAAIQAPGMPDRWRSVHCLENHDIVKAGRAPRLASLADPSDARSWHARSRARVAAGLLLTAPGIPLLFMGQEFLEDKPWSDDPATGNLIWWEGLDRGDRTMVDYFRFLSEIVAIRRAQPALRGEPVRVFHVHNDNRVIAIHRWLEGLGRDVVIAASLNESTHHDYRIGFPGGGRWMEIFNSDVHDHWINPWVAGNGGAIEADGPPEHGMPASAAIILPANSILIFARP